MANGNEGVSVYFEVKSSEEFGRYLVSKEDIDEKTLILAESPLLYGPTDDKDLQSDTVFVFCLACCKQLFPSKDFENHDEGGQLYFCSRCKWPVCDKTCEKSPVHSNNECSFFVSQNTTYPPPQKWLMYKSVIILRLLLLCKRKSELWDDFLEKLEHHTETRQSKEHCVKADNIVLENLEFFTQGLKVGTKKNARKHRLPYLEDKEALQRLIGTLNVNAFCANNNLTKRIARCMFQTASLFAHSCAPNCSWTIETSLLDHQKSAKTRRRKLKNGCVHSNTEFIKITPLIQIYTAVSIRKGEMLTIPYSTRHILNGTLKRQISMESVGHFICKCRRCMDPTELGTFMSSIRCFKCDLNYLVSSDPSNEESHWVCIDTNSFNIANNLCSYTGGCGSICNVGKVVYFTTNIQDQIDLVRSKDLAWNEEQAQLQRLFDKYRGTELHENHYLLQEISTRIVELLEDKLGIDEGSHVEEKFKNILDTFVFHVKYLLKIADVILPGYNNYQDQLNFYLEEADNMNKEGTTSSK